MELERKKEFGDCVENEKRNGLGSGFRRNGDGGNETDLRPEFCRYRDEGCELAESCLNCPFTRCIYDEPGGKQLWMKRRRAREIARLHTTEGKRVKELAEMFGISQRTVQRALRTILGSSNLRKAV